MPITTSDFFGPGIFGFFKEHRWLSNFQLVDFTFDDIEWKSTEHYYQAMKSSDRNIRLQISKLDTPTGAKMFGSKLKLRPDWEVLQENGLSVKDNIMLDALRIKYNIAPYASLLVKTDDLYLEETNHWGDQYWGVCKGIGLNKLGKFTMRVRNEKKLDRNL